MATPIFNTAQTQIAPYHGLPKTASTGLFLHRMKTSMAPKKAARHTTAHGHPIIKTPVIVRPAKPVHTSPGGLFNFKAPAGL